MKYINKNISKYPIDAYRLRGKNFFQDVIDENHALLKKYNCLIKPPNKFICFLCGLKKGDIFLKWEMGYQLIKCNN